MEFLTKKIGLLVVAVAISLSSVFAQDAKVQEAFTNSYKNEKAALYKKAIDDLKAVYSESSYEINLRMGWLHYMAGLFTESLTYYNKAITLMPYSVEARLGYVYPASTLGNWDQVKTQYVEILKVDSKNSSANYHLGCIYYGKADYTNAFKHFETIANLYPFDYDITIMYAWTNFKLGKMREAKVLFTKALLNKPDDKSAKEGLSYIK